MGVLEENDMMVLVPLPCSCSCSCSCSATCNDPYALSPKQMRLKLETISSNSEQVRCHCFLRCLREMGYRRREGGKESHLIKCGPRMSGSTVCGVESLVTVPTLFFIDSALFMMNTITSHEKCNSRALVEESLDYSVLANTF
ncbi:hypothetical protein VNO78_01186 [Psophocarpus tetragonolobus]|uniref:Uncharacterized protein n=1 Tax=Psophocarpus tetragonolobus TaxID=3891 RepID=A0AAN9XUI8_PSOTE